MAWTDLSICLEGPVVDDIRAHFVQRWNFEYDLQYAPAINDRIERLKLSDSDDRYHNNGTNMHAFANFLEPSHTKRASGEDRGLSVQLVRSVGRWSHGTPTEHSIANAYVSVIAKSEHFIYIENQYFITGTSDDQTFVLNKIGAAIVERVIRAAKSGERYRIIVVMPAVPAFAGDVQYDSSPGTLAIMGLQYKSISRGKHSIMQRIRDAGVDPDDYISFYNLRSYDRIDTSANVENQSGVSYESARKEHDDVVGAGYNGRGEDTSGNSLPNSQYNRYQQAARSEQCKDNNADSSGMQRRSDSTIVPQASHHYEEIDAIVSEEVYVHSKFLIADDRVVIVGSANLNDRSQLGYRDSEIAVVIEDTAVVDSHMNGEPFPAARFAAGLRRQLFRRYVGLLPRQAANQSHNNFPPLSATGNDYDWGSEGDRLVQDPLSESFDMLWKNTARMNTKAFDKVFRPLPSDSVRNWDDYEEYYGQYFASPSVSGAEDLGTNLKPKFQYGHVFKHNFPGGIRDVRLELEKIKGTLVEMPLDFLVEIEDLEKEGFSEDFRPEVYA
ncbi:hypothetical protein LTR84_009594 [Exophiala bonariae]|uniref:phospholipase D n=1 Tax=Exophiala bonariae TaxID=1690606 RepID=A0AAV9NN19_9EURO|nr:hypothetical protein LTR84_009594 [Exophiala bonariae]